MAVCALDENRRPETVFEKEAGQAEKGVESEEGLRTEIKGWRNA